jgi:hypothetical protein
LLQQAAGVIETDTMIGGLKARAQMFGKQPVEMARTDTGEA